MEERVVLELTEIGEATAVVVVMALLEVEVETEDIQEEMGVTVEMAQNEEGMGVMGPKGVREHIL
ncbi:MAG: hypothetical protein K0S07_1339 [Chlamydiales bacterium]|nr:hypothetical protein [Chlamydiales bacterium]